MGRQFTLLVLLLLLAGCDWQGALGFRKPPPPVPPGAGGDPLVNLVRQKGGTLNRYPGPTLPSGQQVVFYHHTAGNVCSYGMVNYNPNGTAQSFSQSDGSCKIEKLDQPNAGVAGDRWVLWGFVPAAEVTRVDLTVAGKTHKVEVKDGVYFLLWGTIGQDITPPRIHVVGFDHTDKEIYRAGK